MLLGPDRGLEMPVTFPVLTMPNRRRPIIEIAALAATLVVAGRTPAQPPYSVATSPYSDEASVCCPDYPATECEAPWLVMPAGQQPYVDADVFLHERGVPDPALLQANPQYWHGQVFPEGMIYRSYLAGVREPRISTIIFNEKGGGTLWDSTLGGRAAILRYGTPGPLRPRGLEVEIEGAALVRLNPDEGRDLDSADFRFGVPIAYGWGNWQFKFGYYHLSSHLGDEFLVRNPGAMRINYVRDSLVAGASYYPWPWLRLYGEAGWAFYTAGGAEPWEFQFGTELAQSGPTGPGGTPFLAVNGHLHEEVDFGGNITAQAGWLWRGDTGATMRLGAHYLNGASSQYQFFRDSEQQIGFGLWYDF